MRPSIIGSSLQLVLIPDDFPDNEHSSASQATLSNFISSKGELTGNSGEIWSPVRPYPVGPSCDRREQGPGQTGAGCTIIGDWRLPQRYAQASCRGRSPSICNLQSKACPLVMASVQGQQLSPDVPDHPLRMRLLRSMARLGLMSLKTPAIRPNTQSVPSSVKELAGNLDNGADTTVSNTSSQSGYPVSVINQAAHESQIP